MVEHYLYTSSEEGGKEASCSTALLSNRKGRVIRCPDRYTDGTCIRIYSRYAYSIYWYIIFTDNNDSVDDCRSPVKRNKGKVDNKGGYYIVYLP